MAADGGMHAWLKGNILPMMDVCGRVWECACAFVCLRVCTVRPRDGRPRTTLGPNGSTGAATGEHTRQHTHQHLHVAVDHNAK